MTADPGSYFTANQLCADKTIDVGAYSNIGTLAATNMMGYELQRFNCGTYSYAVASGTPYGWSPINTDVKNIIDIDAFIKAIYYQWTGYSAEGTFSISSDGTIAYTAASTQSVESEDTVVVQDDSYTLGKNITLAALLESSEFSQVMALFGGDTPVVGTDSSLSSEFFGFLIWVVKEYHLLDGNHYFDTVLANQGKTGTIEIGDDSHTAHGSAEMLGWILRIPYTPITDALSRELGVFKCVFASLAFYFYGLDALTTGESGYIGLFFKSYRPWTDLFGKNTITQVQGAYRSYVESIWISARRNLEWNSSWWLCYQRIYADWFLNEHYTKHEDYLDMVGAGYIAGAQSIYNSDGKTMDDWFTAGNLSSGNNPKVGADSTLSYFADRIAKGECMPVLWSLDCVTNLRQSITTSSTPVGSTITENFYNRFYARFKDLINRMGPDYRRNARALYGKGPDDASLLRSQVVGYRSFDVQIGDVAQNSQSTNDSTLGQFAGYAVSRDRAGSFDWTAQESGVFMILAWVRPKYTCFSDLVPRSLYKKEYMDYLIPQFGGVGYQDFANKQLNPTDKNPNSRLGYEERYSEYMMMDNECSGLMRTSMAYYNSNRIGTPCYTPNTADFYHLLYMDEESDLKRVFVDTYNDPVLISAYFNGNVTRQLPATIKTEF